MNYLLTFILSTIYLIPFAQNTPTKGQEQTIRQVVNGYNEQNFKEMKKPWAFLGQVVVRKSMLRKEFAPYYEQYGSAEIDTISCSSIYQCTALLTHRKDPLKRSYLNFIFTDKAKLQGFGFGYPLFIYRHPNEPLKPLSEGKLLIDSVFSDYTNSSKKKPFNGCMLVTQGDALIYKKCNGYANIDEKVKLLDNTKFLLASCSKQFTAMGILLLVDRGLLSVDDTVNTIIKGFPYDKISIKNLLTHTSGLADYMGLLKEHWDLSKYAESKDVIDLIIQHQPKLRFTPNTRFEYSNTGYVVLSRILEIVSKQSYGEFMEQHIFKPLQMNSSMVIARRKENRLPKNYALGYVPYKGDYVLPDSIEEYKYVIYQDAITGDDGISSTLGDIAIWNKALREKTLISSTLSDEMTKRYILKNGKNINYGYGLFIESGSGIEKLAYHTGYWAGYTTMNMNFIEKDISITILSNNRNNSTLFIADKVASIMLAIDMTK